MSKSKKRKTFDNEFKNKAVQYVNEHYDEGDIIAQYRCPVLPEDTPEELAKRVHALEYEFYPQVVERLIKADCQPCH